MGGLLSPFHIYRKMYRLCEPLTKDFILRNLTQEQIMEHYLGVPIEFNKKICSPLRKDSTPTCGFRYAPSGDLYFRDFSGHFAGNAFNIVQFVYNCNFNEALEIIAKDFGLQEGETKIDRIEYNYEQVRKDHQKDTIIQIESRAFSSHDKAYWSKYAISSRILKKYGVTACNTLWLNGTIVYTHSDEDPAYAYKFDPGVYKIYYPQRKKQRFLCNTNVLQGEAQLPNKGELLIITKSMKDVLCLAAFGIVAVAPQGESQYVEEKKLLELQKRFKILFTFYDFDLAGVRMSATAKRKYGIHPIFLTNGRFGTFDYGAKDWTDFVETHGKDVATMVAESFKQAINEKTKSQAQ